MQVEDLWALLGSDAGIRSAENIETVSQEVTSGIVIERLMLTIAGSAVPAILTRPDSRAGRRPAVLYCHVHGNKYETGYEELLSGGSFLCGEPYGVVLARQGLISLCLEMPCFGARADLKESQVSKALLWNGQTLLGAMLSELSAGVGYLLSRPDVDPARISTLGMSMGGTHAYWLAALDDRISAVVQICVFANLRGLIALKENDLHGIYFMVPGLLAHGDAGDVAGMVAPRRQLICVGTKDRLTPRGALEPALQAVRAAYADKSASGALQILIDETTGHKETQPMRDAVLTFLTEGA